MLERKKTIRRKLRLLRRVSIASSSLIALLILVAAYRAWTTRSVKAPIALSSNPTAPAVEVTNPRYPFSVIPGGVRDAAALKSALLRDKAAARHYRGFDVESAVPTRLKEDTLAYVSYRVGDQILWTNRKVHLARDERVLSDGSHLIRVRCGNRISFERQPGETSIVEPNEVEMDLLPETYSALTSIMPWKDEDLGAPPPDSSETLPNLARDFPTVVPNPIPPAASASQSATAPLGSQLVFGPVATVPAPSQPVSYNPIGPGSAPSPPTPSVPVGTLPSLPAPVAIAPNGTSPPSSPPVSTSPVVATPTTPSPVRTTPVVPYPSGSPILPIAPVAFVSLPIVPADGAQPVSILSANPLVPDLTQTASTVDTALSPEPATWLIFGLGLLILFSFGRSRIATRSASR